jgi:hypothetical protein
MTFSALMFGGLGGQVILASNGATWTVPTSVTQALFLLTANGGGGGSGAGSQGGGGGGAGGAVQIIAAVTAGDVFTYTRSGSTATITCTTGSAGTMTCTDGGDGLDANPGPPFGGLAGSVTVRSGRFASATILTSDDGGEGVIDNGGFGGTVSGGRSVLLNTQPQYGRGANGANAPGGGTTPPGAQGTHGCFIRFGGVL